ncbi:MAG: hypothetical protein RIS79_4113 [Verrucomicrobiota bacterium]|jgi:hypothetical protein
MKNTLLTFLSSLALVVVSHAGTPSAPTIAAAADQPAVSGLNGKVDSFYGAVNRSYIRGTNAALSLPVGQNYGLQLDGLYARGFETDIYGYGAHFFRRDPSKYLLGLAAGAIQSTDFNDVLVGVEGELYFKHFTLGAFAGYNNFDTRVPSAFAPRVNTSRDFVAARVYAAAYPIDNLMISAEWQNRFGKNFCIVGLEYQTPVRGMSVFVDGGLGDNDFRQLTGGLRIYFGGDKPLKARHRQDDPENITSIFSGTGGAAISGPRAQTPAPAPLPPT